MVLSILHAVDSKRSDKEDIRDCSMHESVITNNDAEGPFF